MNSEKIVDTLVKRAKEADKKMRGVHSRPSQKAYWKGRLEAYADAIEVVEHEEAHDEITHSAFGCFGIPNSAGVRR